jgi:penicillin-binding protein 2
MYCVVAAFAVLVVRLFYLQVIEGQEYRRLSENNSIRLQSVDAPRGLVFDRNGRLLVDNRPSFDLNIVLKDAKPVDLTVTKLADYMNIPTEELASKIDRRSGLSPYKPVLLKQDIGRNALAAIEVHKFDLPGIVMMIKPRRHYIYESSAAHLIGYMGEINNEELDCGDYEGCRIGDYIGKFGIERVYESTLRGERGGRQVEVNVTGQVVRVLKTVDAKPGKNIYLTIDHDLQAKTEKLLETQVGAALAMDPKTGEILALVSSPSYDQNAFVSGMSHETWEALITNPFRPMENKAIQAEYPPASTYKIVAAIAALEEGIVTVESTYNCPGYLRFGDRVFRCWRRGGHGSVNIVRALAESCDVFFYNVGQELGVDTLARYAKGCGLGRPSGIGLANESQGLVPTAAWKRQRFGEPWQGGETLPVVIGQGFNLVTPIQMLVLIAAVGNDGVILKPQLVKKIETAEGSVVATGTIQTNGHLPASPQTLALVKQGLWEVVNTEGGTARGSRLAKIAISGKTGTAQVVGRLEDGETETDTEREAHLKAHAWFVAYAPSDDPQIAIAVIVEHGEHGSSAAAPLAREMIRSYLMDAYDPRKVAVVEGN